MPTEDTRAATHWRCHHCKTALPWLLYPACTGCDHQRCPECIPLYRKYSSEAGRAVVREPNYVGAFSRSTPDTPPETHESQRKPNFWKCHRCLTSGPRGDETTSEGWKCTICRHLVCWDCSSTFSDGVLGMGIPGLTSALGPNLSYTQDPIKEFIYLEQVSLLPIDSHEPTMDLSRWPQKVSSAESEPSSKTDLETPLEEVSDTIEDGAPRLASDRSLSAKTSALQELQQNYDELLALAIANNVPLEAFKQRTSIQEPENALNPEEMYPSKENTQVLGSHASSRSVTVTPVSSLTGPELVESKDERSVRPLGPESKIQLVLRLARKLRVESANSSEEDGDECTASSRGLDTPYNSSEDFDPVGLDSDDSVDAEDSSTSEDWMGYQPFLTLIDQMTHAYLLDLASRPANLRGRAPSSNESASQNQRSGASNAQHISFNNRSSNGRKKKRNEDDEYGDDWQVHKRSRRDKMRASKRLFACPYCKYDRRRYSEQNLYEKHYRHCSSTYSVNISRLKQHLDRVHKRPDFYCSRCFIECESRAVLDDHLRSEPSCLLSDSPFQEKMTHAQSGIIKSRRTTNDQVASWYAIYEILFPGSCKPESPYAEQISPDGVEDFEEWFLGQELVLRDCVITQAANELPALSQDDLYVLDQVLVTCLSQLARQRGPDFHLEPEGAGSSIFPDHDYTIQGTTALEVAEELEGTEFFTTSLQSRAKMKCLKGKTCPNPNCPDRAVDFQLSDSDTGMGNRTPPVTVTADFPAQWFSESASSIEWAMVGSDEFRHENFFTAEMEALGHETSFDLMIEHDSGNLINQELLTELQDNDEMGSQIQEKGKGKATN